MKYHMNDLVSTFACFIAELILCAGDTKISKVDTFCRACSAGFSWTVLTIGYSTAYGTCPERGQLEELTG